MDALLEEKFQSALWAAHSLFDRGKTAGSSANLSFRHGDKVYISAGGSCFGTMGREDFVELRVDGTLPAAAGTPGDYPHVPAGPSPSGRQPSKEFPLHLAVYEQFADAGAVIHTHSTYSVLWSFVPALAEQDCIPEHTPYLRMKLGKVGLIPYEKPGSRELFAAFRQRLADSDGYILKRHGPVVPGRDVMEAFCRLEELEESARIAWELYRAGLGGI